MNMHTVRCSTKSPGPCALALSPVSRRKNPPEPPFVKGGAGGISASRERRRRSWILFPEPLIAQAGALRLGTFARASPKENPPEPPFVKGGAGGISEDCGVLRRGWILSLEQIPYRGRI